MRFDGGWRMYVSLATPEHEALVDRRRRRARRSRARRRRGADAFTGDAHTAVKDPIVGATDGVWQAWICCHLLDLPGEEDRMNSAYATSADGLSWDWHGTVLEGRPGEWDSRGARLTHDPPRRPRGLRRPRERGGELVRAHGIALPDGGHYVSTGEPVADVRYLEALPLPDGGYRIFYEARLADETHELRTELLTP